MPHLTDMKLSKKQSDDCAITECEKGPRFPYGLSVSLDDDSLKKLGFSELPAVGTEMIVVGVGKVTRASASSSQHGNNRDVTIQLESVEVEPLNESDKTAADAVTSAIKDV